MNQIRKERTRELFIDIACDIIRNKGMKELTIRNVAALAGYNSATLYTYFDNLPHLILCAQIRFETELKQLIEAEFEKSNSLSYYSMLPHMYIVMTKYYLENPSIFDCEFCTDFMENDSESILKMRDQNSEFVQYTKDCLLKIAEELKVPVPVILAVNQTAVSLVIGTVLFRVKHRVSGDLPFDYVAFEKNLNGIISDMIERTK